MYILFSTWPLHGLYSCHSVAVASDWKTHLAAKFVGSCHHAAALFLQVPEKCTDLDLTLCYFSTLRTYGKIVWKNICYRSSFARSRAQTLATRLPRQDHFLFSPIEMIRLHTNEFWVNEMPCELDPCSFHKYLTLLLRTTRLRSSISGRVTYTLSGVVAQRTNTRANTKLLPLFESEFFLLKSNSGCPKEEGRVKIKHIYFHSPPYPQICIKKLCRRARSLRATLFLRTNRMGS